MNALSEIGAVSFHGYQTGETGCGTFYKKP